MDKLVHDTWGTIILKWWICQGSYIIHNILIQESISISVKKKEKKEGDDNVV